MNFRSNFPAQLDAVMFDNREFAKEYDSPAEYYILNAETLDNWDEFYEETPTKEQIDAAKEYLYENWSDHMEEV